ncbi:GLUG motif-containing protein [Phocaeicola dorei]|nr:GLUG motif-containing protein [Phocaeicola dorei]
MIKCIFMKSFLLWSVVLLIGATSCTDQLIQHEEKPSGPVELTFSASNGEMVSGPTTRTLVREGLQTFWVANDRISLIDGANVNNPFITKDGGVVTNFKGKVTQPSPDWYCALYPYNRDAQFDENTFVFTTRLYTHQYAEPGSYASGMNLAVGRSLSADAQDLGFYNAAAYLCVTISPEYTGDDISSMRLSGNNDELLAGDVTIPVLYEDDMIATVIDNENASGTIYLDQAGQGQTCIKGKNYYFVLAPTNMTEGYTLTLVNEEGRTATIQEAGPVDFGRNVVHAITIEEATFDGDECGKLTDDGLFTVTSLDCLYEWAERVSGGEYGLGCYITADIDFANATDSWPQLGTDEHPFTGRIIGNGKTISNFKSEGDARFAGFVAVMGEGGSVESLSFDSPTVTSTYHGDTDITGDDGYVGTIVGRLNNEGKFNYTEASIRNCRVTNPALNGGENVGGIVGRSYGRNDAVDNCTVEGGTITGQMFVGGIVGNTEGIIHNCHVKGGTVLSAEPILSEVRIGGIVGTNNSGQIVACTANVTVSGDTGSNNQLDSRYVGGIAGANNGTIVACAASGRVKGAYGGAIAGESYGDIYASYANQMEAAAVVYRIKKNMNDAADVIKPTFKACYVKGGDPSMPFFGTDAENGNIVDCQAVGSLSSVLSAMNAAIEEVAQDSEYEYGAPHAYVENTEDDSSAIPYKAVLPQE